MADRRQFITGIATVSTVGIAGCADTEEEGPEEETESEEEGPEEETESEEEGPEEETESEEEGPEEETESEEEEPEEETEPEEDVSVVLPPDSNTLFDRGELREHDFENSSFTEDQVGTDVSEFDLENADTSNVENMGLMFYRAEEFNQDIGDWDTSNVENMGGMFVLAESFNQDISGWCVEQITEKPNSFDNGAGFEGEEANQPNWGEPC